LVVQYVKLPCVESLEEVEDPKRFVYVIKEDVNVEEEDVKYINPVEEEE
jgi:hypothetical protein